jgi:rfaE bifunctional protein kinase chain/domain
LSSPPNKNAKNRRAQRGDISREPDSSVDLVRLLDIVASFPRQTICVIGDLVVDEFVSGEISRVSREAPVLILRHRHSEFYPGGGANAVNNIADLGARVLPVGVLGNDETGRRLRNFFRGKGISTSGIVQVPGLVTTRKTRFLAGWTHTTEQQVLRVDHEPNVPLPAKVADAIVRNAQKFARHAGAVLVSDYGLGVASPALIRGLSAKEITLDSRYRLLDYRNSGVSAATPNEPELEAAYHSHVGTDLRLLEQFSRRALQDLGLRALVVTRGKDGMAALERNPKNSSGKSGPIHHIPIFGSDAPVDVTGAGDTVIAVFTLALGAGASYLEAAHLANYAAGIVVMKRRTASVTRVELESLLRREATLRHDRLDGHS